MSTRPRELEVDMKRVAVIGAGAAGLCCARHLNRYPETFQFTVFEQSDHVGGVWTYRNTSPGQLPRDVRELTNYQEAIQTPYHSTIYKNLRTNLPKEIMLFPGFPMDKDLPSFPGHCDVNTYLEKYLAHYKLKEFVQFETLVEKVFPVPIKPAVDRETPSLDSVKWSVTTQNLATKERNTEEFDSVLICNGHFFAPYVPEFKGLSSFPRPVIHSSWYREPEPFAGQAVAVVGAGPSGMDLIVDLSSHARVVYLSSRKGPLQTKVPENVEQLPGISELKDDGRVCFENGEEKEVDCVVLASGYLYSYPFLSEESGIKIEQGRRVTHLFKHTFNVTHPSMALVGINSGFVPFPTFDLQVQWILAVWHGDKTLPSEQEMRNDDEETYQSQLREGFPPHRAAHHLGEKRWELNDHFVSLGGLEPPPPVVRPLYNAVQYQRAHNVLGYRDASICVLSDTEFSTTYE